MPTHKLDLLLPKSKLINADAEIVVYSDGAKLGTVQASKGGINWRPAWKQTLHYVLTWEKFDEVMRQYANERK
jgi:hypothetical protein